MDDLKRPEWVSEEIWISLNVREKRWCKLRANETHDDEMMKGLGFVCGRTWRYFLERVREKIFGIKWQEC